MVDDHVVDEGLPWLGDRIRSLRIERDIALTELARRAKISRSYLYELEKEDSDQRPVPTAVVLYRLARGMGVSVADLIEPEPPRVADLRDEEVPRGLVEAAKELGLSRSDVQHLANIRFRGQQPQSASRWKLLIQQLELSQPLDEAKPRRSKRGDEQ
jgi:XRE family transcriptional regulator of biofilm formation